MSMSNTVLPLYKAQKKKKGNGPTFSLSSVVLLAPLVFAFFLAGLYVGSQFVQSHETDTTLPTDSPPIHVQPLPSQIVDPIVPATNTDAHKRHEPIEFGQKPDVASRVEKFDLQKNYHMVETALSKYFVSRSGMFMTAHSSFDHENTIVSAWFYMDPADAGNSMKTVFGNKGPGCETNSLQHGYAVYVNGWETSDGYLYAEWGGQISGCHKISSEKAGVKVTPGKWHHVAVALSASAVTLYLDGEQVAQKVGIDHSEQMRQPLVVGAHANHEYPFVGRISNLKVLQCSLEPTEVDVQVALDLWNSKQSSSCRTLVHYPLNDFDEAGTRSQATDMIGARHGKYATKPVPVAPPAATDRGFVDGVPQREVTPEMIAESEKLGRERREHVKAAMVHAWEGYKTYAWGRDELKPLSKRGQDNWGGLGVTLVDSLSTLWIMDLKDYFWEARDWVRDHLTFDRTGGVSTFETTIRELGGLLGAYDLSGDRAFLDKAVDLGHRLSRAFDTPTGIARAQVNLKTGTAGGSWAGHSSILAELGTLQLEFCYLSKHSGDPSFCEKAMKAFEVLYNNPVPYGLFPTQINPNTGKPANKMVTFGALGDSFFEYLLKVWLQGGRKDARWREMYDRAMDGVAEKLLQISSPSKLLYMSDWDGVRNYHKMDHLVCFLPGVLALGAYTDPNGLQSERAQRDLAISKGLMYTCYQMYARMATGIAPEYVNFVEGKDLSPAPNAPFYILRPETAESLFVLNQLTKEPIYRDWAWEIFEAIEKHCKTEIAYGSLPHVQRVGGRVDDRMESFFLAETLKYLYLAQDPDHPIDLMKYVFNTEAHPTRIFES